MKPGYILLLALMLTMSSLVWALDIQARGLLKDAAILVIDGRQQLLKVGQRSSEGVLLVSSNPKLAIVDIDGKQHQVRLSRQITSQYNPVTKREVAVRRNPLNQYITNAAINGKRLQVLVDTGANAIAMSSRDASRLKIDYQQGQRGIVRTASGEAPSYSVTLRSVSVGGIQVSGVRAFVIEGNYPQTVLLGMSFLQHVDLKEQNGILYLTAKY